MVTLKYTVHSAAIEETSITIDSPGHFSHGMTVKADRLVLELTGYDTDHGHTFRLPVVSAEELAAQREKYQPGVEVSVTLG